MTKALLDVADKRVSCFRTLLEDAVSSQSVGATAFHCTTNVGYQVSVAKT
jgi:hypothetical protein